MAIISLKSENPKLSWIIVKNPETGMLVKSIRKGSVMGWYSDKETYNAFFKDANDEISFSKSEDADFEYLDGSRYSSPLITTTILSEIFKSAMKIQNENDIDGKYESTIKIASFHVNGDDYIGLFPKYFPEFDLTYDSISEILIVKTKLSIFKLLNFINIIGIFAAIKSHENIYVGKEDLITKYVKSLRVIESPYFVKYIFKTYFLRNREAFNKYNAMLQTEGKDEVFVYGSSGQVRRDFIKQSISGESDIIDIGCGKGYYLNQIADRIGKNKLIRKYTAIDKNLEMHEIIERKFKKHQYPLELATYESFNQAVNDGKVLTITDSSKEIIMAEVIEHMERDEANTLLQNVCSHLNSNPVLKKVIITTPCSDFNEFYMFNDEDMRHEDHKFELTRKEFEIWMCNIFKSNKITFYDLGDKVNGIPFTLGCIVEKK